MHLLTPGPVEPHPRVLEALSRRVVSHRNDEYHRLHKFVVEKLAEIGGLAEGSVYLVPGSGTTAVDAMIWSFLEPGDRVAAYVVGEFGERAVKSMEARGVEVRVIWGRWGEAVDVERLRSVLESEGPFKAVFIVHNETSTGVANRVLPEVAKVAHDNGAFLLVDSVSGFAGEPLLMDAWGVDVVATATQKCLGAPPGLGIVLARREVVKIAMEVCERRPPPPSINLMLYEKFLERLETPFTPPVNVVEALAEALRVIEEFGVENWIGMHRERAEAFYKVIDERRLETLPERPWRSHTVAAVKLPRGVKASEVKKAMLERGYVIATGMGHLKERVVRLGLMGPLPTEVAIEAANTLAEVVEKLSSRQGETGG